MEPDSWSTFCPQEPSDWRCGKAEHLCNCTSVCMSGHSLHVLYLQYCLVCGVCVCVCACVCVRVGVCVCVCVWGGGCMTWCTRQLHCFVTCTPLSSAVCVSCVSHRATSVALGSTSLLLRPTSCWDSVSTSLQQSLLQVYCVSCGVIHTCITEV